jgi:hypothetical protein
MPPPSPVWAGKGGYQDATFRVEVKIEGRSYVSEPVLLRVKKSKRPVESPQTGGRGG